MKYVQREPNMVRQFDIDVVAQEVVVFGLARLLTKRSRGRLMVDLPKLWLMGMKREHMSA